MKLVAARPQLQLSPTFISDTSGVVFAAGLIAAMCIAATVLGIDAFSVLVSGLALGSLYAVVALGYTMVYGIIELINFAHGDVFALGAFVSLTVMEHLSNGMVQSSYFNEGVNTIDFLGLTLHLDLFWISLVTIFAAMIVAAVLCGIAGVIIERVAYRPLRNAPRLAPLITAIGVSLMLENALFQWQGGVPITYPSVMFPKNITDIGPFHVGQDLTNTELVVMGAAVVLMLLLDAFINRSKMGKAMRSVAQDREAAQMMGINVDRIIALTFFVGSAMAGAGAVIYGIQVNTVTSNMGFSLGLFAFTAAVLGGIGNIRGAMVGGLLIGVIERFVDTLGQGTGTEWATAVVFMVLILILIFRPSGFLGSQVPDKV
ncbi:MAG: branched-chain amino acid ABC transporter permease [Chloroflexota bacterium]